MEFNVPLYQLPWRPIFEKCSHLREKGKVLIFFPGLYGWLYGQNLPYKFKKSYGDFLNRNFDKSHRTTGPRSDLRPDSWTFENSGLDTASRILETDCFRDSGDDQGDLSKGTVLNFSTRVLLESTARPVPTGLLRNSSTLFWFWPKTNKKFTGTDFSSKLG